MDSLDAMERMKVLEEELREASCLGDIDSVKEILNAGINVNAKHDINGWSSLHWAAKRGHKEIVNFLIAHGADTQALTRKGETPAALSKNPEICQLLEPGCSSAVQCEQSSLPITPHYLKHQSLNGMTSRKSPSIEMAVNNTAMQANPSKSHCNCPTLNDEIVLKVRLANTGDPDFIEVEIPRKELSYSRLLRVCCEELGVNATQVLRIRKLPDTLVRKDKDVQRFHDFQEIEIVTSASGKKMVPNANGLISSYGGTNTNGYQSISLYKNQTILY